MHQTSVHNLDHKQPSIWVILCILLAFVLLTAAFSFKPYAEVMAETATPVAVIADLTPPAAPTPATNGYSIYLPLLMCNYQYSYTTLERMGFCSGHGAANNYPLDDTYGIYADYTYRTTLPDIDSAEYVQMIMVRESIYGASVDGDTDYINQALTAAVANPGSLWIIGNEPECPYNQGNRTPEQYAEIYHRCYMAIKEVDPTARIAVGGVVEPTPLRLEWLDRVLAHYEQIYGEALPADVWTIHNQVLQEVAGDIGAGIPVGLDDETGMVVGYQWWNAGDMTVFSDHIGAFRQWMADNGYRECELIVSEFGFLYPPEWFGDEGETLMETFMEASYRYMLTARDAEIGCPTDDNLLVQRWLWYSMAHPGEEYRDDPDVDDSQIFGGALCDPFTHEIKPLGEFYLDMVSRLTAEFDS